MRGDGQVLREDRLVVSIGYLQFEGFLLWQQQRVVLLAAHHGLDVNRVARPVDRPIRIAKRRVECVLRSRKRGVPRSDQSDIVAGTRHDP